MLGLVLIGSNGIPVLETESGSQRPRRETARRFQVPGARSSMNIVMPGRDPPGELEEESSPTWLPDGAGLPARALPARRRSPV